MNNFHYLILYIFLWVLTFLVYLKKQKKNSLGGLLLIFYGLSAVASLWMSQQVYYYQSGLYVYDIPSFAPLLYLFVTILLFSSPIFFLKNEQIKKIDLSNHTNSFQCEQGRIITITTIIFFIASFIVLLSIFPMISNVDQMFTMESGGLDKRAFQQENVAILFSNKISIYAYTVWKLLKDIMICFSFLYLQENKKKVAFFLFLCSAIMPIVWGLVNANRQQVLCVIITIITTFFLLKNTLQEDVKKKFYQAGAILGIPTILFFIFISLLRFGDHMDLLIYECIRYFGEPHLNFSSILFDHQQNNLWGVSSFPSLWGLSIDARRYIMAHSAGIVSYIFYSFVGNFVVDFGKTLTIIFATATLLIALSTKPFKVQNNRIHISSIILIQFWLNVCFQGLFFFTYLLEFRIIIVTLLMFFWLKIKYHKRGCDAHSCH